MAVIAFVGLGQMGSPMASNLLKQGHQLSVFDVNPDAIQTLVEKGARPASSPAQAAKEAELSSQCCLMAISFAACYSAIKAFAKACHRTRW